MGLLGPMNFESSRQGNGAHQSLEAGDPGPACIGKGQSKGPSPGPAHKGTVQRSSLYLHVDPGGVCQFLNCLPNFSNGGAGIQCFTESHRNRIGEFSRYL